MFKTLDTKTNSQRAAVRLHACRDAQRLLIAGHHEEAEALLVEAHVPAHRHALARLALLHGLVVVRLHLHQRPEHVLVLVCVLHGYSERLAKARGTSNERWQHSAKWPFHFSQNFRVFAELTPSP